MPQYYNKFNQARKDLYDQLSPEKVKLLEFIKGPDVGNVHEIELERLVNWPDNRVKETLKIEAETERGIVRHKSKGWQESFNSLLQTFTSSGNILNKAIYQALAYCDSERSAIDLSMKMLRAVTLAKNKDPKLIPPIITVKKLDRKILWLGADQKAVNESQDIYCNEQRYIAYISFEYCQPSGEPVSDSLVKIVRQSLIDHFKTTWTSLITNSWGEYDAGEWIWYYLKPLFEIRVTNNQKNNLMTYVYDEKNDLYDYLQPQNPEEKAKLLGRQK